MKIFKELFNKFDQLCNNYNLSYSIDCDTNKAQGYLILKQNKNNYKLNDFTSEVRGLLEDPISPFYKKIKLTINPSYNNDDHNLRKDGILFYFTLNPILDSKDINMLERPNFSNRLNEQLNNLSFKEPDILGVVGSPTSPIDEYNNKLDYVAKMEGALCYEYAKLMDLAPNNKLSEIFEDEIKKKKSNIKKILSKKSKNKPNKH